MTAIAYTRPRIAGYGNLVQMSADAGMLMSGLSNMAALSSPAGGVQGGSETGSTPTDTTGSPGTGSVGSENVSGGESGGSAGESTGTGASSNGSGGGSGGEGSGGDGKLPFTGFPAAIIAGIGGAFTTAGIALRRGFRRRS